MWLYILILLVILLTLRIDVILTKTSWPTNVPHLSIFNNDAYLNYVAHNDSYQNNPNAPTYYKYTGAGGTYGFPRYVGYGSPHSGGDPYYKGYYKTYGYPTGYEGFIREYY